MDKTDIAIELLHKVGSGGVTANSIALVLEAFEAANAPKAAPKKAAPEPEVAPVEPAVEAPAAS